MENNTTEKMIRNLLDLKLKAYDDFLIMTQRLDRVLESQDMEEADGLIAARADTMRAIDALDQRIFELRTRYSGDMNPSFLRQVEKIFADMNMKIRVMMEADEHCRRVAAGQCAALQEALKETRREAAGRLNYAGRTQRPPKFLDVQT